MSCRWLLNRPYGFITPLISFRRLLSLSFFIAPGIYIYTRSRSLVHRGQGSNRSSFLNYPLLSTIRAHVMSSDVAYLSSNFSNIYSLRKDTVDETRQLDKRLILRYAESFFTLSSICVFREVSWCLHPLDGRWSFHAGDSSTNCMRTLRVRIIQGNRAFQLGTLHRDGALCRISTEKGVTCAEWWKGK